MKPGSSYLQVKRVGNLTNRYMSDSGQARMVDRVSLYSLIDLSGQPNNYFFTNDAYTALWGAYLPSIITVLRSSISKSGSYIGVISSSAEK